MDSIGTCRLDGVGSKTRGQGLADGGHPGLGERGHPLLGQSTPRLWRCLGKWTSGPGDLRRPGPQQVSTMPQWRTAAAASVCGPESQQPPGEAGRGRGHSAVCRSPTDSWSHRRQCEGTQPHVAPGAVPGGLCVSQGDSSRVSGGRGLSAPRSQAPSGSARSRLSPAA